MNITILQALYRSTFIFASNLSFSWKVKIVRTDQLHDSLLLEMLWVLLIFSIPHSYCFSQFLIFIDFLNSSWFIFSIPHCYWFSQFLTVIDFLTIKWSSNSLFFFFFFWKCAFCFHLMHMCKLKHSEKQLSDFYAVHQNRVGSADICWTQSHFLSLNLTP